jgi:hypothetical protein
MYQELGKHLCRLQSLATMAQPTNQNLHRGNRQDEAELRNLDALPGPSFPEEERAVDTLKGWLVFTTRHDYIEQIYFMRFHDIDFSLPLLCMDIFFMYVIIKNGNTFIHITFFESK